MEENNGAGRFLPGRRPRPGPVRYMAAAALLAWDILLLYMITADLIEPVYGAGFVALVSVYLGYQL